MRTGWAIAVALVASPAAAADQFDLVCNGRQETRVGGKSFPVEHRYRIDLQASKWCIDQCASIEQIASNGDNEIALINREAKYRGAFSESVKINRLTGVWVHLRSNPDDGLYIRGECKPAAFSGLPEVARRF